MEEKEDDTRDFTGIFYKSLENLTSKFFNIFLERMKKMLYAFNCCNFESKKRERFYG